jgi:23S rRNA (guanosine2251-2'-O)-methyltransferase
MLIYGKQPIYYILQNHPKLVQKLYLAKEIDKKEYSKLMKYDFEVKRIPSDAADKMCKSSNHQGMLAEIEDFALTPFKTFLDKDFVVVLSSVTDVGNIGAIVRSAYAFGVDGIVATGVKQLAMEPIMRSSSGALCDMPFSLVSNLYDVINDLKMSGFTIYGAVMDGEDIRDIKPSQKRAIILGSEGEGLPLKALSRLDKKVAINMKNGFNSLNVSVAGAILMDRMRG